MLQDKLTASVEYATKLVTPTHVAKVNIVNKGIQIVLGVIILLIAHVVGTIIKQAIMAKGKISLKDISKNVAPTTTKAGIQNSKENIQLVYVTFSQIAYYGIMIFAAMIVLKTLGIEAASFIALLGAIGFALGLALQGTLSDVASGILLIVFQTYAIGDIIQVDDKQGRVVDFTLVQTVLLDQDTKTLITIPNGKVQQSTLQNHTKRPIRYISFSLNVSNKTRDFTRVINIIKRALASHPKVLDDPPIVVGVHEMGYVGTIIKAKGAIKSSDYKDEGITLPIKTAVREALAKEGVVLVDPF